MILFLNTDIAMTKTHFDTKQNETVTRAHLSEAVYGRVGLSRADSAEMVETVLGEISDAIVRGEIVKLSSFGSLWFA
ncbi:MAG: himA [Hyphomicrobiales bacterium]|nr:himA [Hyphomicrobiales bacterium]